MSNFLNNLENAFVLIISGVLGTLLALIGGAILISIYVATVSILIGIPVYVILWIIDSFK